MFKQNLTITKPILNAAGSLGFAPDPVGPVPLDSFGAFITNPISLTPRSPARMPRFLPFSGGFLLHTGYPNPGLRTIIKRYAQHWARAPLPVIVHLLAQDPADIQDAVRWLEEIEGVSGLEIGLPPGCDTQTAARFTESALGELPVILSLPFDSALTLANSIEGYGIAAVSLSPPRGALAAEDGTIVHGRLYGPGLMPRTLLVIQELVEGNIPVIAAGGIYRRRQIMTLLDVGVLAVQLDTVLWLGGLDFGMLDPASPE